MKKSTSLPDDYCAAPSYDDGSLTPAPAAASGGLFVDDDADSYPFALSDATAGGSTNAGGAKPVASIATLASYLVSGFWQYNNTIAHHWASSTITYNITGLNTAEQFLAQSAMQEWHDVANVTFVQTTGAANITFVDTGSMQAVTNASWYSNGTMATANVDISSDWITNDGGAMDGKTGIDSYGFQTYIHEIGHALGLGHQGPYNGSAVYSTNATYADDTWQYSIMSYFAQNNYSGSTYRYVVTPQMADIYAVQQIYGASTTTRTGDTVYGFHSNAGAVYDFSAYTRAPAFTIYDSGGNDTLDCSGYTVAQTIDLHAGAFSSVGGLVNNIGISLTTNVETAICGSGNDTLIANDSGCTLIGGAGNDTLTGGASNDRLVGGSGVDTMTGGGGADTFVFAFGDSSATTGQHDRVTDFVSGTDHIDLTAIDAIVGTAGVDQFYFIGTTAFDGRAGELDYFYNSTLGVTVLQGDTNGDRVADFAIDLVGNISLMLADIFGAYAAPVVIESFGATTLSSLGGFFYLNAAGTGPALKYAGTAVTASNWTPIGAEQTASGYEIAWKIVGSDQYAVWNTDTNGNYVSNAITATSGTSLALEAIETSFHQDLNGDGVIGIPSAIVIEAAGSTTLSQVGQTYYLFANGTSSGPAIQYGGSTIVVGASSWSPIAAEQVSGGYEVAWKLAGSDTYTVWNLDSNGNYVSDTVGNLSGSSATLKAIENDFHQDLNGDGSIGLPATIVESAGATSLEVVGSSFFLYANGTTTGPTLKSGGVSIVMGLSPWTPIGAETVGNGYEVAWKLTGSDSYQVWNTDSDGNFVSSAIGVVNGADASLQAIETSFHQDLNGDGHIGLSVSGSTTAIEAFGSTKLDLTGTSYSFDPVSGGTGPTLMFGGVAIVAGQSSWAPIGVEQTSTGYQVAWKLSGSDSYTVWNTDSAGNYVSSAVGAVAGNDPNLQSMEDSFHQDLNGDGTIGPVAAQQLAGISSSALAPGAGQSFQFSTMDNAHPLYLDQLVGKSYAVFESTSDVLPGHGALANGLPEAQIWHAGFLIH